MWDNQINNESKKLTGNGNGNVNGTGKGKKKIKNNNNNNAESGDGNFSFIINQPSDEVKKNPPAQQQQQQSAQTSGFQTFLWQDLFPQPQFHRHQFSKPHKHYTLSKLGKANPLKNQLQLFSPNHLSLPH